MIHKGKQKVMLAKEGVDTGKGMLLEEIVLNFDELKPEMSKEELRERGAHKTIDGRYVFEGLSLPERAYFHISYQLTGNGKYKRH